MRYEVTLPSTVLSFNKEFVEGFLTIQYQKQNLYFASSFADIFVEEFQTIPSKPGFGNDF